MPRAMYTRAQVLALKTRANTMVPCAVYTRSKARAGHTVRPTVCSSVPSVPPNTYRIQRSRARCRVCPTSNGRRRVNTRKSTAGNGLVGNWNLVAKLEVRNPTKEIKENNLY
ncbi:hypothetical protein NDU88_002510 [Pleurodeles waltl]|uniref:Uncharacterized protein n=1 Tax=Pleurodeles waltl TaxID=8319 RepID=A0AAV7VE04_PLEWA|nr:hypothetical protein NDU88_002510 [Pleurodeles waltl]